jgi:small-conductance mechanosensitive channel
MIGDTHRVKFVFVYEMSVEEAKELLRNEGAEFTEDELKYIFDNVGTNSAMLQMLVVDVYKHKIPLKECVELILSEACKDFQNFKLDPILLALKEHPEGIETKYFKGQEFKGVDLKSSSEVVKATFGSNAILCRFDTKTKMYQVMSTAHKTALKTYDPSSNEASPIEIPNPHVTAPPQTKSWWSWFLQKRILFDYRLY